MDTRSLPYSWGDIADALSSARSREDVPKQLAKAEVFWDQITLHVDEEVNFALVRQWLSDLLPLRVQESAILLDGPEFSSQLPIEFVVYDREASGEPPFATAAQFVAASTQIWFWTTKQTEGAPPPQLPTFAFHSVKGGVGRTTSAISFSIGLARNGRKPLLVDADFEAPGISYLFLNDGRECHFSLEDLIVLAHAEENISSEQTVQFATEKLANQRHNGVTFLPCLRRAEMLSAFAIRPEQLQMSRRDRPYFLVQVLQELAVAIGCDCLVVDLRAGFTDLAAMVLCAPGVSPVFVTTPSGQAIHSTREMLAFIGREVHRNVGHLSNPAIIVNNVIPQVKRSIDFTKLVDSLAESANAFVEDNIDQTVGTSIIPLSTDDVSGPPIVVLDHVSALTASPMGLSDFIDDLSTQACFDQLNVGLAGWSEDQFEESDSGRAIALPVAETSIGQVVPISERRRRLRDYAQSRVFADSSETTKNDFLVVRALREMGERFITETPNATCIGMKGAGKTFTFRLLAEIGTWTAFLDAVSDGAKSARDAIIMPTLPARNLQSQSTIVEARGAAVKALGGEPPIAFSRLNELVDRASSDLTTDSDWGAFWLDVVAWSSGFELEAPGAGNRFAQALASSGQRAVALFDGLEEAFQSFRANPRQQAAIRGLTSSLPQKLLELPGRPLGQINFVRSDLAQAAFTNNYRQFVDRHRAFSLTWFERDILELAAWLAYRAGVADTWTKDFQDLDVKAVEERLVPLWGRKLGKADDLAKGGRTREPRSVEWVIAALSDLRGRLTARDLVGFVANSAEQSILDVNPLFFDRLLVPRAMTNAIGPVGLQKMDAMGEENPELKKILAMLKQAPQFALPLRLDVLKENVPGLADANLELLKDDGVILVQGDSVEMPEIFRTGLGNVVRSTGGRKSIIGLMNKARKLRTSYIAI